MPAPRRSWPPPLIPSTNSSAGPPAACRSSSAAGRSCAMSVEPLLLGAVAYDPKVVTIWEGFRRYLDARGMAVDYVLYSNYERQVDALLAGQVQVAWNSPLA